VSDKELGEGLGTRLILLNHTAVWLLLCSAARQ